MADAATQPGSMQVKNTFIDIPAPATPMPVPLASAPARNAGIMQDSLQKAAEANPRRAKPNPLNFMSQNSMVSIPESPAGVVLNKDPMAFLSGSSDRPATPAYNWGVLQTPTETPMAMGLSGFSAAPAPPPIVVSTPTGGCGGFTMPAVATPTGGAQFAALPARTTLSLQDMIQSPKVEQKTALLQSSYQQLYQVPQQQMPMYHQMGAPPPAAAAMVPQGMPQPQPIMQQPQPPQPATVVQSMPPPVMSAPSQPSAAAPPALSTAPVASSCASVALGLVPSQPQYSIPSVNSPVVASMPPLPPQSPPHMAPAPVFAAPSGMPTAPPAGQPTLQPAYMSQPPMQPPMQAPNMPPTNPPVYAAPMTNMPPPPPTFAAPTVVMSPKASAAPPAAGVASESDIKTLLEVAVASGNQEAISAVMRQAQQAGMSPEKFRSLLPAPLTSA